MTDRNAHRRRFLKVAGAAATTATVAGCKHNTGSGGSNPNTTTKQLSAPKTGLRANTLSDLGLPSSTVTHIPETKTVIDKSGGSKTVFKLSGHKYSYHGSDIEFPVQVYATPSITVSGTANNPTGSGSLRRQLLNNGPFSMAWMHLTGILQPGKDTFTSNPWISGKPSTTVNFLGNNVAPVVVKAEYGPSQNASTSNTTAARVALARTTAGGTIFVVGVAATYPATGNPPTDRLLFVIREAMKGVKRRPSNKPAVPINASITDERLVQTVSRTIVRNGQVWFRHPHDPDLVAGEHAAPLFGLTTGVPKRVYCNAKVKRGAGTNRINQFWLARGDARAAGGSQAAKFDRATRDGNKDDPPTFVVGAKMNGVDLQAEAPSGYTLDSTTLSRGSDYKTATVRPVRIGFTPVHDDSPIVNYGGNNGRPDSYVETVDLAVEYMHRVYPGELFAFRLDNDHVNGHVAPRIDKDARDAQHLLESARRDSNFPNQGTLYAPSGSIGTAEQRIRNHGFDAWVLITPDGYWNYHPGNAAGLALPSPHLAVLAQEADSAHDQAFVGHVVAQEVAHHFVANPYQTPSGPHNDLPMAQRDGILNERKQVGNQAGGVSTLADMEHARHLDSNTGPNEPTDQPGVVSECFDLTGGRFTLVEDYNLNPNGFDPDTDSADSSIQLMQSFMSYTNDHTWTDAEIHQELIQSNWQGQKLSQYVFSAAGTVDDQGRVRFDETAAFEGNVTSESVDDGGVEIELRHGNGETLQSLQIRDTLRATHAEPLEGIVAVQVPFPEGAVELRARHGDQETQINVVTRPMHDAVERIPKRGFRDPPGESRGRLLAAVDDIKVQMKEGQYGSAVEALQAFSDRVHETVKEEYERSGLQPNRNDLALLAERMIERLAPLAG